MKEKIMLNPRALAAAVVAVGTGAVLFLSSGQEPASSLPAGGGPVPGVGLPVMLPPSVSEVPSTHPAVPAAQRPVAPSTATPAPTIRPTPKGAPAKQAPARKVAPKRAAAPQTVAPATQQPQPAGTEPNGTGGWQLPACYEESCVADPNQGTGTQALNAGPLGQAGIVNTIADLIGWH